MRYSSGRSIYPNLSDKGAVKDSYMRAFILTNELSRLEYEKKVAAIKITTLEKRIGEVRDEIDSINSSFKDTKEIIDKDDQVQTPRKRHVTMEY